MKWTHEPYIQWWIEEAQKHFQLQWLRQIVAFWFPSDPSPCNLISHWCLGDLIDEILATKSCWCWCWGQLWQKLGKSCTAFHSLATDWKFLVTVYTNMAVYSFFKQIFLANALNSWILCAFGNVWVLTARDSPSTDLSPLWLDQNGYYDGTYVQYVMSQVGSQLL